MSVNHEFAGFDSLLPFSLFVLGKILLYMRSLRDGKLPEDLKRTQQDHWKICIFSVNPNCCIIAIHSPVFVYLCVTTWFFNMFGIIIVFVAVLENFINF